MKTTTINILGRSFAIAFNFSVVCLFEEQAGRPLDITSLQNSTREQVILTWALLKAAAADAPSFDELSRMLTPEDLAAVIIAFVPLWAEFYRIPLNMQGKEETQEPSEPKNE